MDCFWVNEIYTERQRRGGGVMQTKNLTQIDCWLVMPSVQCCQDHRTL